jgi:integrase/recombinase XerD
VPALPAIPFDNDLIESWSIALRAQRKSRRTVVIYVGAVRAYVAWCRVEGFDVALDRRIFEAYLADLIEENRLAPATIASRHIAVRQFSKWLCAEDQLEDPLLPVKSPKVDEKVTLPFTDEQLKALFTACKGVSFRDRRDEALCRLMAECGPRASDVLSMTLTGTSVSEGTAIIRGKGGGQRIIAFGPQTARSLDRYVRVRKMHRLAQEDAFWLGDRGSTFAYNGLYKTLNMRARDAGIDGFHLHRFRHTFSDRWLDKGGSEGGLMAVAGWKTRKMVDRYTKARAALRAVDEARRLELGDL